MTTINTPVPAAGDTIAELVRTPTETQLFAFSAVTWNSHRIHYDRPYARDEEGYPDILVQSHLFACFLAQAVMGAFSPQARVTRLGWQNRGMAVPGDQLTVTGEVTAVEEDETGVRADLALEERNQRGELCVKGWASVVLPKEPGS